MPIIITKTLQGDVYSLYFLTEFKIDREDRTLDLVLLGYRSKGHFLDNFLPILRKEFSISNRQVIQAVRDILNNNNGETYTLVLDLIERQITQRITYFTGGVVEPREP